MNISKASRLKYLDEFSRGKNRLLIDPQLGVALNQATNYIAARHMILFAGTTHITHPPFCYSLHFFDDRYGITEVFDGASIAG